MSALLATLRRRVVRSRDRAASTDRPTAQTPAQESQRVVVREYWPAPGVRGGDDW